MVDQLRFPQWFSPDPVELGLPPNLQRLSREAVSFARHYTVSNDCSPGARRDAHRALHAPDRLHDHRRQHARPRLSHVGHDAARARLPHALARQVAPHPRRQPLDRAQRRTGARALRLRRRHLPLARRRPRPGLACRPAHRAPVRGLVRRRGRRRALVHDRLVRQPARHRLVVHVERPRPRRGGRAAHACRGCRPTSRRRSCCASAASRACSARFQDTAAASFGPGAVRRPRSAPRSGSGFLDLYAKLQRARRPPHRPRAEHARKPPRGRRQHRGRVHLRPRRVRRLARAARQGRRRLRGVRSACR